MADSGSSELPEWSEQLNLDFDPTTTNFDDLVDISGCLIDIDFDNLKFYEQANPSVSRVENHTAGQGLPIHRSDDIHMFDFNTLPDDKFTSKSNLSDTDQYSILGYSHTPYSNVPPTPNSGHVSVLHPSDAASQQMGGSYVGNITDFSQLTPLVSPAVSLPEDQAFGPFDYSNTSHYAPLTSPALLGIARSTSTGMGVHGLPSIAHSPLPLSVMQPPPTNLHIANPLSGSVSSSRQQSSKRRSMASSKISTSSRPKQSPIVKPMRRKTSIVSVSPSELQDILDSSLSLPPSTGPSKGQSPPAPHTSEPAFSIPQPDTIVPIYQDALHPTLPTNPQPVAPVTPSSLMSMGRTTRGFRDSTASSLRNETLPDIDEFILPDPMARLDVPSRTHIMVTSDVHPSQSSTPSITSQTTSPSFGPLPTMADFNKIPSSRSRSNKSTAVRKRGSTSTSTFVSPALRPKISPAIKPLLPKDSPISPEAHTLLLASRSNFQRILDGSVMPGSFPDDLTRELHSKRASHKLAEQGRRNRINSALMELQSLLPNAMTEGSPEIKPEEGGGCKEKAGAEEMDMNNHDDPVSSKNLDGKPGAVQLGGHSKASTVESAILYIKQLQQDAEERERALEEKLKESERLQQKLTELTKRLDMGETQVEESAVLKTTRPTSLIPLEPPNQTDLHQADGL